MRKLQTTKRHPLGSQSLPSSVRTRSGVVFDPRGDRWSYRDNIQKVSLPFKKFKATAGLVLSVKFALIWYAENLSSGSLVRSHNLLKNFFLSAYEDRQVLMRTITATELINYRAKSGKEREWQLGHLSSVFQKWKELGIRGVTADAIAFLEEVRLKGGVKGRAVRTRDLHHGPYSELEFQLIHASLERAFECREISLEEYAMASIFKTFGPRPCQIAAMKIRDVLSARLEDGSRVYPIRIPRAKQQHQLTREEFTERLLIPQIGKIVGKYRRMVKARFEGQIDDPEEAPLFPASLSRNDEPPGFEFHRTAGALSTFLENSLDRLQVISERTGKLINITPTRFRRTVGTRAAEEGMGELVIAEILDHSDTQNVKVYVEFTSGMLDRIDYATAMALGPLAQAFAGKLIRNESEAIRGNDPTSRICDPRIDPSMRPLANCGKYGFCGLRAPIACYTCIHFQPWLDAPHKRVLMMLIEERDKMKRRKIDIRIVAVNDRTIAAVAQVVVMCAEINGRSTGANTNV
jgi:integrase